MKDKYHEYLLMSAILPSTLCCLIAGLVMLFILFTGNFFDLEKVFLFCLLGILGFYGLLKVYNNRLKTKLTSSLFFLSCGFISYILIFYSVEPTLNDFLSSFQSIVGFLFTSILIWIFFVYVFYIVLISNKLFQENF